MRLMLLLCFLVPGFVVTAQKGLEEMIAAERSFAAYSVKHGTKEAFVKFLDTSAILFNNGLPVNGYQLWKARPKAGYKLNWWPTHAEIARLEDWGWTAGPWTYSDAGKDSISATGYFFTIWQKMKDGWKVILDVGTDTGPINYSKAITKYKQNKSSGTLKDLKEAEQNLHQLFLLDSAKAYFAFAQQVVVGREGIGLMRVDERSRIILTSKKGTLLFMPQGANISPGGDLGYTYGTVESGEKKETYLRIWRHQTHGWKLALEMLRL